MLPVLKYHDRNEESQSGHELHVPVKDQQIEYEYQ